MNYRHAYHAGNFADVQKHAVLALVVEHLKRKDSAFFYLDSHSGIGAYDLGSIEAGKTLEWYGGIGALRNAPNHPPELTPYLDAVAAMNAPGELRYYPGSPALVAHLARAQDRLALCELHPIDAAALKSNFYADPRVGVHHMNGYDAIKGLLPPKEKRGLVLIDPPFEKLDEFIQMRKALQNGLKRFSHGLFALWYPIKSRDTIDRFHADLKMSGLPKTLVAEVLIHSDDRDDRLNGAGMILVNPPWKLDESLGNLLPYLCQHFPGTNGSYRLDWLVPE